MYFEECQIVICKRNYTKIYLYLIISFQFLKLYSSKFQDFKIKVGLPKLPRH